MRKGRHSKNLRPGDQVQILSLHNKDVESGKVVLYIPAKRKLSELLKRVGSDPTSLHIERAQECARLWDRCLIQKTNYRYAVVTVPRVYKMRVSHAC